MTDITSKFVKIEMFYTSDGVEFMDDSEAREHQDLIDQKKSMCDVMGINGKELSKFIKDHKEYIKQVIDNDY